MCVQSPSCTNKGFILDGFPKCWDDALALFMTKVEESEPVEEEAEEEKDEDAPVDPLKGFEANQQILPQSVIVLEGDDVVLKQRIKELVPDFQGTHWNDQGMDRRAKLFRELNPDDGETSIKHFFLKLMGEGNVAIEACEQEEGPLLGKLKTWVERNGKPCCLNLITESDNKFLKHLKKEQRKKEAEEEKKEEAEQEDEAAKPEETLDEESEDEITKILRIEAEESKKK